MKYMNIDICVLQDICTIFKKKSLFPIQRKIYNFGKSAEAFFQTKLFHGVFFLKI